MGREANRCGNLAALTPCLTKSGTIGESVTDYHRTTMLPLPRGFRAARDRTRVPNLPPQTLRRSKRISRDDNRKTGMRFLATQLSIVRGETLRMIAISRFVNSHFGSPRRCRRDWIVRFEWTPSSSRRSGSFDSRKNFGQNLLPLIVTIYHLGKIQISDLSTL
jgi:hypothetical protein